MKYCTPDDLMRFFGAAEIERLVRQKQHETGTEEGSAIVEGAIDEAMGEINMYLESRNFLPVTSVPDVLCRLTADLARFYLYLNPKEDSPVLLAYKRRVKQLEGVAAGRLSLGLNAKGETMEPEGIVLITPEKGMFGRSGGGLW